MKANNFTPLDIPEIIKEHFPHEKRTFDIILLLIGALSAGVLIMVIYFIIQQRFN